MAVNLPLDDSEVEDSHDHEVESTPISARHSALAVSIVSSCLGAALVGLTVTRWRHIFEGSSVVLILAASCVAGLVAAVLARVFGQRLAIGAVGAAAGLVVVCVVAFPSEVSAVPAAVITGWKRLATEGLLMTPSVGLVVPPVIVCGAGSFVGGWLAFDARLRARAIIIGVLAVATSLAYTIDVAVPGLWFGVTFALVVGLLLAADAAALPAGVSFATAEATAGHTRRSVLRATASVGAIVLGTGVLASLLSGAGMGSDPLALREELQRPVMTVEESTPLAGVKAGLVVDRPSAVFSLSIEGLQDGQVVTHVPVAVLESFDGAVFASGGIFTPAGAVLPGQSDEPTVVQQVTLAPNYPFRSLPRVGAVRRLDTNDLLWNESTGTIAVLDPVAVFEASVQLVDVTLSEDSTLGAVPSGVWSATGLPADADVQLAALDRFIASTVTAPQGSIEVLLELEAALRSSEFGYNENAPGGHSLAAIAGYLDDTGGERASRIGFAEQSAAAFALLARRVGLPARVVVGYQLETPLSDTSGVVSVTEDMIHAWPEVWTEQGWARAEPTNKENAVTDADPRRPVTSADSGQGEVAPLDEIAPPLLAPELTESVSTSTRSLRWLWLVPVVGVVAGVLIAKRLRTSRRRRQDDPNRRAIAAWDELRDRLDDLGYGTASHESTDDLADRLTVIDLRTEARELHSLGPMLDDALYSPAGTDDDNADAAWDRVDAIVGGVRSSTGRPRRVQAAVDPRTLIRR